MKVRIGFVSNSSSSSFVMIGARVNMKDISKELLETDKIYKFTTETHGFTHLSDDNSGALFGEILSDMNGDDGTYIEEMDISIDELNEKANKIRAAIKKEIGVDVTPGLITGTRSC